MINLNKPKFWDKKIGFIAILLFPLSLLVIFSIFLKRKIFKIRKFKLPIICIGNIYIGGTGKTPTSILLAKELEKSGKCPVILRKYYGNHIDEYNLIRNNFKNLIISKNRVDGLLEAEKSNFDIAILDDGLQDYKINKNVKIVCFNGNQLIGNGLVIPSGPLRENLSALKDIDIALINGNKHEVFEKKLLTINQKIKIFYSYYKPTNLEDFSGKKLIAIAGIGNPDNFFQLIEKNNLKIYKKMVYPDHYEFSKTEIENILNYAESKNYQIIMTEKDYFKVNTYQLKKINYLKISLIIKNKDEFFDTINLLNNENN